MPSDDEQPDVGSTVEFNVRVQAEPGDHLLRPARALVRAVLDVWDCDDPDDVGALLTSEIVTNAIRHAARVLTLQLDVSLAQGMARVAVEDATPAPPVRRSRDVHDVDGLGLHLVEMLATRWGSDPTDRGKVVWFEFPIRRRSHETTPTGPVQ